MAQLSTAPMHVGAGDDAVSQADVGITTGCASNYAATLRWDRPNHFSKSDGTDSVEPRFPLLKIVHIPPLLRPSGKNICPLAQRAKKRRRTGGD